MALGKTVYGWNKSSRGPRFGRRPNKEARTGVAAGLKSNRRALGAPIYRRDPTAHEKLSVLLALGRAMTGSKVTTARELPKATKRRLEREWAWPFETLVKWMELKPALEQFVATHRVGLHGVWPGFNTTRLMGAPCKAPQDM